MPKKYTYSYLFFLLTLTSFFSSSVQAQNGKIQFDKIPLTIWLRAHGEQAKNQLNSYLNELTQELDSYFDLTILVCTNPNDSILTQETNLSNLPVKFICADMASFNQPLNTLADQTPENHFVFCVSLGVPIQPALMIEAFGWIKAGAWVYGWNLSDLYNDGSQPGKGWYNTATLYSPICIQWLKQHPFPNWINNGAEGTVSVDHKQIPIGGNEEIYLMGEIIHEHPNAFFVLNNKSCLHTTLQTGTTVSYSDKLKRKVSVAHYYLEKKLNLSPEQLWEHLLIIDKDSQICNGVEKLQEKGNK